MKNIRSQLLPRSLVFVLSLFSLGLSTSHAQIGELGIYGCPPASYRDDVRYVKLNYNEVDAVHDYILPVNGLRNFNFLYNPDGQGFLPGGGYTVIYLSANQSTVLGSETITYQPNSGHTNGNAVRPFNNPPSTPRGLHGKVYARIGGVNYPFSNASVHLLGRTLQNNVDLKANGEGFFSAYYTNGNTGQFLPVNPLIGGHEHYDIAITGYLSGCGFSIFLPLDAVWEPYNSVYPDLASYFVTDAETDVGDLVVNPNHCVND